MNELAIPLAGTASTRAVPVPMRLLPSSDTYRAIMSPYNEAAARGSPRYVVVPRTMEEVRDTVRECQAAGLRLSIHATGHDFEGRSLSGDVVLHTAAFDQVTYDAHARTLTVGGGARVHAINDILARAGRAISTGTNQDVGIVGLTLGGGAAYTSRLHGLTCDALIEAELCTFAGEVMTATDKSAPAIMRLLRGGGSSGLVVTKMTFKTYAVGPVTTFGATWDGVCGADLLAVLEELLVTAPREISMRVGANVTGSGCSKTLTLSGQVQGGDEARLAAHFGTLRRTPTWRQATLPYYEAMRGALHVTSGGAFKIKSRFGMAPIGRDGLAEMLAHLDAWPSTRNEDGAGFGLFAWGGRIRDTPAHLSCMPARAAEFLASFDTSWTKTDATAEIAAQLAWVSKLDAIGARRLSDLAYVNFPDSDEGTYETRHLGPILPEITAQQARLDPCGLHRPVSRCRHLHSHPSYAHKRDLPEIAR